VTSLPRTVVFDLDGTLADTAEDIGAAMNRALHAFDLPPLALATVRAAVGEGGTALARTALAQSRARVARARDAADRASASDLVARLHERYLAEYCRAPVARTRPYPGTQAALARLAEAGVRLAVCTNKPQAPTLAILAALGLRAYFAAIVGVGPDGLRKPDPRHLRAAIERAGGSAGDAVLIGDTDHDAAAALAAGVPFLRVGFGYGPKPAPGEAVLHHFDELEAALAELELYALTK
jgi:phosphoglycolate phosphatase